MPVGVKRTLMCMLFADWGDINNAIFGAYLSLRGKKLCCCALDEFFDWHLLAQPCTTPTCFFAAIDGVFGKARLGLGEKEWHWKACCYERKSGKQTYRQSKRTRYIFSRKKISKQNSIFAEFMAKIRFFSAKIRFFVPKLDLFVPKFDQNFFGPWK